MNREDFEILKEQVHGRELVYLDNAATSQKPRQVVKAIVEAYSHWNSNIHRGVHHLSQVATAHHEEARQAVADFIGAKSAKEIIFTKGTTDSINTLAFSIGEMQVNGQPYIQEGDEIIVSGVEHHSNIVPWQMLCRRKKAVLRHVPLKEDLTFDIEAFKGLLSDKTRLVSVAHVSNVLGIIQPVEEIIRLAHEKSVPVCLDGAQSVPHMQVNVQALDCDFMAFSGHKMYGPTGIGVLYGKKEWLEQLPPAEGGGEMIEHVRWEGTTYNTLPYKFEAGTPNFVGSYALHKAIEYMQSIGWKAIEAHKKELTQYCEEKLKGLEGIHIYAAGQPKAGVISFNVYNALNTQHSTLIHPFDVGTLLDQQGVAVRTGHHCAEPLIDALGVPGTVRVSFGLYNDKNDVDAFIAALQKAQMMLLG
ncbi:MAG: cysteine desulfurase [Paludibacteraceae bacterium]|nr:cysteine desulfurase [Paludibacteraceae bacterium]